MAIEVAFSEDPVQVLDEAGEFLASDPVLHNVILTLLHGRIAYPEPGRYWMATDGGKTVGVVFQSPLDFPASPTPMKSGVIEAMVDAIWAEGVVLPGVLGEAATASRFAGQWTEHHGSAATPVEGQRIYELTDVRGQTGGDGSFRKASVDDRDLLVAWMRGLGNEIAQPGGSDPETVVDRKLSEQGFWLLDVGEPASMAAYSEPVEGVVRIQAVYTPPEKRNHGYAEACVRELSKQLREDGYRCILYTELANPTSNSIYRRIGYDAVAEALRYRFE